MGTVGSSADFGVYRYNADGTRDSTFGAGGSVTLNVAGTSDQPAAVLVQTATGRRRRRRTWRGTRTGPSTWPTTGRRAGTSPGTARRAPRLCNGRSTSRDK
ncbi:MAG: hypothetical protein K2P78_00430 [Gemmataceae bacterium]|nr:hypothetical protein [Gemmataceae bacterium]